VAALLLAERAWRCGPVDNALGYAIIIVMALALLVVWKKA
jgi:hypothetical protein